jgi:hypothetical protein
MLELVFALTIVLLFSAWFASFFDRRVRLGFVPVWRRFVAWGALLLLTVSLVELLYCFELSLRSVRPVSVVFSLFETGLTFAGAALLTCWFGSRRTRACLLPSALLVAAAWFLVLARVA